MSTHARPLADRLSATSDAELARLLAARGVRPDAGWHDFFDAAEALLEPASITRVLPQLPRAAAAALQRAAPGRGAGTAAEALTRLALLRDDGVPHAPVIAAIADRDPIAPAVEGDSDAPPAPASSPEASAHAAEHALMTVAAVADLLLQAREAPLTLLAAGGLSAGEKRRLVEAGIPVDSVDALIETAQDAGLVTTDDRRLRLTSTAEGWLLASAAERWSTLVAGFHSSLPRGVRRESGWLELSAWTHAHPWDPAWPSRSAALIERATLLGLVAADGSEPEWTRPLRADGTIDAAPLLQLLPAEVDRIFLQNDLSAIAPGRLAPALDVRLRAIAARESAAQASSYRFTPESVAHALVAGETEDSIIEFLGSLSLTGIPQPVAYLISQTAQRHGLVRVSVDDETGRTRIESSDQHLLDAIAVDQALRPLALSRHVGSLTTRVGRDTVYWALSDARYPATLVDERGEAISPDRHPAIERAPASAPDYAPLIARLRAKQGPDADADWLDRELEAAVRAKAVLRVTVGMPDGSTRELLLEATGLGGGRLRGLDRAADVERTLPVSSIRAASVVES